ncbi:LOW QUALITY PROTEIN: UB2G1-like protein [Mya arenaria]|uniref:UB2G1-like protein n=1 Tax=Mya arenaria TaxID=6604 RepID=A0ABY7E4U5_MYAAR|nr:LOW QUALITY PROTEIN: UB2G1-like protein [Mya arenaria]
MASEQSALLLRKQLTDLNKNPVEGFSAGPVDDNDIYKWEVVIIGPQDTLYEGGMFKALLTFSKEYPQKPPKMLFTTEIRMVCISILHEPGDDKWGYESASERWLPIHTVETIIVSVISMLAEPNDESPANVDAAVRVPGSQLPESDRYVYLAATFLNQIDRYVYLAANFLNQTESDRYVYLAANFLNQTGCHLEVTSLIQSRLEVTSLIQSRLEVTSLIQTSFGTLTMPGAARASKLANSPSNIVRACD